MTLGCSTLLTTIHFLIITGAKAQVYLQALLAVSIEGRHWDFNQGVLLPRGCKRDLRKNE